MSPQEIPKFYIFANVPLDFVLAVKNDIVVGAKLFAEKEIVDFEGKEVVEEPEEKQAEESTEKIKVEADKCL